MSVINSVTIAGNIGNDARVTMFNNDSGVAEVNVAVTDSYKDKQAGEFKEKTSWIPVKIYGKSNRMDFCAKSLLKGTGLMVTGAIEQESWTKGDKTESRLIIKASSFRTFANVPRSHSAPVAAGHSEDSLMDYEF